MWLHCLHMINMEIQWYFSKTRAFVEYNKLNYFRIYSPRRWRRRRNEWRRRWNEWRRWWNKWINWWASTRWLWPRRTESLTQVRGQSMQSIQEIEQGRLTRRGGHTSALPAREINLFTALTRIRFQFLRTQWSTSNHSEWTRLRLRPFSHRGWL